MLDARYQKLTSHNQNDVFYIKLISRNRDKVCNWKLISHDHGRICYQKPMLTIQRQSFMHFSRENDENEAYNLFRILYLRYNIPPLPFLFSCCLKLLQNRPTDLRWATIVVVMQITVAKAQNKLQQHFACYQLAHYLVAHY